MPATSGLITCEYLLFIRLNCISIIFQVIKEVRDYFLAPFPMVLLGDLLENKNRATSEQENFVKPAMVTKHSYFVLLVPYVCFRIFS